MPLESWLAFVATSAILLVIPGPTILTVVSYSMTQGRSSTLPLIAAVALGDSTALALSLLGLGTILATSAFWFTVVKTLGGLYLIFLGVKMLAAGVTAVPTPTASAGRESRWKLFANTYAVTATNPKGIVFYVAFLPQFVDTAAAAHVQLWIMAVTFVMLAIVNATLYTFFASSAARLLASRKAHRAFNLGGGSLLCGAGLWTLFARRAT
jgi:threonine/homoserine/homoserine lactone efflux protein